MAASPRDFDERVGRIVNALLTDPLSLPKEFKGWLPKYLEVVEPALHLDSMVGNINANRISARSITADKLEAVLALVSALLAGDPEGARVEIGKGITFDGDGNAIVDESFTGIRAYDGDGNLVFKLDAAGGTAQFSGRVGFGSNSRLTVNDMVQIARQTMGTYQTPALEQSNSKTGSDVSSLSCPWDNVPTENNTLILTVALYNGGGGATITATGWTEAENHTFASGDGRQAIYYKTAGPSEGNVSISFSAVPGNIVMQIFEYTGLQAAEDGASNSDSDNDANATTGVTGTITQDALVVGCLGVVAVSTHRPTDLLVDETTDYTQVASDLVSKSLGGFNSRHLQNEVLTKLASSGTEELTGTSNGDFWGGAIATFAAATAAVETAEADSARLYSADISGVPYLHAVNDVGTQRSVALGSAGEVFDFDYVTATKDFANVPAHTGTTETVTVTGLAVGDLAFLIGDEFGSDAGRSLIVRPNPPVCSTTDTLTVEVFNTKDTDSNPTSVTLHFLVIHRS